MTQYVYGPVLSRRIGRSLGVDLVPLKTCTLNCVYCQLGPTPATTLRRAEYVPADQVVEQVRARLAEGAAVDYVTLGGSGEPTLHDSFGQIAERVREFAPAPIALLTNGTLFHLPEVRAACGAIDLVIPDLDAGDEETFRRVNRPHPDLSVEKIVGGLAALRDEFAGQIWLEVFLVPGLNTTDEHVRKLRAQIERIRPDRIDLNTAVRPPAEDYVRRVPAERLEQIRDMLGPRARVIAEAPPAGAGAAGESHARSAAGTQQVLEMLRRRPCTLEDLASGLSLHRNEVLKHIAQLLKDGKLVETRDGARLFYRAR